MNLEWDFHELFDFGDRLGDIPEFEKYARQATRELAKVLHEMLFQNTPVLTGNLCAAWGGAENYAYTVRAVSDGYVVTLINKGANDKGYRYGYDVNYGHYSYNQYGGAYGFVKGRFFVEKSVADSEVQLEQVLYNELEKWFRWCLSG